ncbi:dihydroxy-acid dehydratase domain-containing protein [Cupriavidus basilensis]
MPEQAKIRLKAQEGAPTSRYRFVLQRYAVGGTSRWRSIRNGSRKAALEAGGTAQFAGGTPAMCDGVTQGQDGMDLSLFSRDVIARCPQRWRCRTRCSTARCTLGVCDKIVPGLVMGALSFGHLPAIFVPGGPMTRGHRQ